MNLLFENINNERVGDSAFIEHYEAVNNSMNLAKLRPSIRQATQLNILKWIKLSYYNALYTRFAADTLTDAEAVILPSLQDAIAHYSIVQKLDQGGASLSELGLHYQNDDGNTQNIPQWQFFAAKYDLTKKADAFLERFLDYVFENESGFEEFITESELYFINSPKQLSKYISIENPNMLFVYMSASIRKVSRTVIHDILTKPLYNSLLTDVRAETNLSDLKKELLELVNDLLSSAALLHAIPFLNIDLSEVKLFAVTTNDGNRNRAAARQSQINLLIERLEEDCEEAKNDLIVFVNQNLAALGLSDTTADVERVVESTNSVGLF